MNGDAGRSRRLSFLECIAALHVALVGLVLKLGGWTTTCFSRFDVGRQRNRAEGNEQAETAYDVELTNKNRAVVQLATARLFTLRSWLPSTTSLRV
jgi:hypothetical protein